MVIEIDDMCFEVGTAWEELSLVQLREMVRVSAVGKDAMTRGAWEYLIRTWLGADWEWWKKLRLSVDVWEWLKVEVSWIWEERLQRQPFVFFEHGGIKYYLPGEDLGLSAAIDVSMGAAYMMAVAEGDVEAVDWLMAVFCREERKDIGVFRESEDWNGDVREVYSDERCRLRAEVFAGLDVGVKLVVVKYLEGIMVSFLDGYRELFGSGDEEPRYGDGRGWLFVLKGVAKSGYFRSLEEVWRSSAGLVWGLMLDDVLDNKKAK